MGYLGGKKLIHLRTYLVHTWYDGASATNTGCASYSVQQYISLDTGCIYKFVLIQVGLYISFFPYPFDCLRPSFSAPLLVVVAQIRGHVSHSRMFFPLPPPQHGGMPSMSIRYMRVLRPCGGNGPALLFSSLVVTRRIGTINTTVHLYCCRNPEITKYRYIM